jgi:hypothetical protein
MDNCQHKTVFLNLNFLVIMTDYADEMQSSQTQPNPESNQSTQASNSSVTNNSNDVASDPVFVETTS